MKQATFTAVAATAATVLPIAARAATAGATGVSGAAGAGSVLQVILGLAVVLGLMAGAAWLMKRFGVAGPASANVVKVVGGVNVGSRERVMVVEVADQWIVVGVAQGRVNALSTMPRQEIGAATTHPAAPNFAAWLKQTMDKRNGNQQ